MAGYTLSTDHLLFIMTTVTVILQGMNCQVNTVQGCHMFNGNDLQLLRSKLFGREATEPSHNWDDDIANQSPPVIAVRRIRIAMTSVILSFQFTYVREDGTLYVGPRYGDFATTFNLVTIDLALDECIVQVSGLVTDTGSPVMISFSTLTSAGKATTYGPYGSDFGGGSTSFNVDGIILGFFGTHKITGTSIQGIGFDYLTLDLPTSAPMMGPTNEGCFNGNFPLFTSEIFGNQAETQWNDSIASVSPRVVAVRRLRIVMMSLVILSVQVTYEREDGSLYEAPIRGDGSVFRFLINVNLAQDDCIVNVDGTTSSSGNLVSFALRTTRITGGNVTYGAYPYGSGGEVPFSFEGNVLGFIGTESRTNVTGIGFIYQPLVSEATTSSSTTTTGNEATTEPVSQQGSNNMMISIIGMLCGVILLLLFAVAGLTIIFIIRSRHNKRRNDVATANPDVFRLQIPADDHLYMYRLNQAYHAFNDQSTQVLYEEKRASRELDMLKTTRDETRGNEAYQYRIVNTGRAVTNEEDSHSSAHVNGDSNDTRVLDGAYQIPGSAAMTESKENESYGVNTEVLTKPNVAYRIPGSAAAIESKVNEAYGVNTEVLSMEPTTSQSVQLRMIENKAYGAVITN